MPETATAAGRQKLLEVIVRDTPNTEAARIETCCIYRLNQKHFLGVWGCLGEGGFLKFEYLRTA